jgi:hypothetical protein
MVDLRRNACTAVTDHVSEHQTRCLLLFAIDRHEPHIGTLRRASQMASASIASFFCRFTNGFT